MNFNLYKSNVIDCFESLSFIIFYCIEANPFYCRYRHNIIDCLLLLISALQEKSKTFSSMEKQWTEAAFNSVELTLFFTYMEEYEKKSEVLNSIAPFIATWASISLDDKFAGSNQDKLKKELKVK